LRELLLQPEMIEQLRDRFRRIQEGLTTTIQEAATLTDLSQAQLRYAEARGMLAPHRVASVAEPPGARGRAPETAESPQPRPPITSQLNMVRGQRRYTADNLLRAHFIAFLLVHGYTLTEIDTFMQNNTSVIAELLQTNATRLRPLLDVADTIQFNRFFMPRVLYNALSLIFERESVSDAGIIFPVRAQMAELEQLEQRPMGVADDLVHLGQTLVAWCARGGPVITFLTTGNPFAREQRVQLKSLRSLQIESRPDSADGPVMTNPFIFIAYEPKVEAELEQADRTYRLRLERELGRARSNRRAADPRAVAGRLTAQVQRLVCEQLAENPYANPFGGDALLYTAPELINPALGDALLNRLADTIVDMGAHSQTAGEPKAWSFACVMTPRKPYTPLNQQELVVRAQSRAAPHRIDVTTTAARRNGGLTFRAYTSGRVAYRPEVTQLDPAISYADVEQSVKSAVAAPVVEGHGVGHSQPPAVLYLTSTTPRDFDHDDFLIIRVMGRLVGEIVQTLSTRGQQLGTLTDTLDNPEIVDPYFAQFLSDSDFIRKLGEMLIEVAPPSMAKAGASLEARNGPEQASGATPSTLRSVTIVGLDINDYSRIEHRQGSRVARMLVRELGSRAQQRMDSSFSRGVPTAWLYRAWGDRFYLLIRDEDVDVARTHAERIRSDISGAYRLDGDTMVSVRSATNPSAAPGSEGIAVGVRLAGMALFRDDLLAQLDNAGGDIAKCVASLTRLLDDGLKQANETPDRDRSALWWNVQDKRFAPAEVRTRALGPGTVVEAAPAQATQTYAAPANSVGSEPVESVSAGIGQI